MRSRFSLHSLIVLSCVTGMAKSLPAATPTDVISITIDPAKVIHVTDPDFAGINVCALWNKSMDDAPSTMALSQMNMKLVRFPGGVPAEWYNWERPLESGFTKMTPDGAWAMAKAGGAEMMFQTNAANDKAGSAEQTAAGIKRFDSSGAAAAGWVKYSAEKGIKVAYWEIGNEPEMDAPKPVNKGNMDKLYKWYNPKFEEQAKAIKAVSPSAKVMGPASTNTYFWWAQHALEKFMQAEGNKEGTGLVDAVSIHWYPDAKGDWTKMRGTAQGWPRCMEVITGVIQKYDTRPLPLFVTEWNFAAGDKSNEGYKLSNALGTADVIGMFRDTGVAGHTFFVFHHIDHNWGVLADQGEKKPHHYASPTYYALTMANLLGQQVLAVTNSADPANVLSAYAARSTDGSVQIMLINKTEVAQTISLKLGSDSLAGRTASLYTLSGEKGTPADQDVIYNGAKEVKPAEEKLPPPKSVKLGDQYTIEPYSLNVIVLPK